MTGIYFFLVLGIAGFIDRAVEIGREASEISGPKLLDFKQVLQGNKEIKGKIEQLKQDVNEFAERFPLPGFEEY